MKSYAYLVMAALLTVFFVGCGGGGNSGNPTPTLVSIAVTPTNPSTLGNPQQFTATGTFSDNTTQDLTTSVTWSSSATSVATVGSNGKATPVAAGTSTITAASGDIYGSAVLTVTQPTSMTVTIAMNPPITSLATLQFTLVNDTGATYNNDFTKINQAANQQGSAFLSGNNLNIGVFSLTVFDTLSTPIVQLSYNIAPGSGLPGVHVSPTDISATTGIGSVPINPPLTSDNFLVNVEYK